jgi:type VI secretion system secreted protein Hcp
MAVDMFLKLDGIKGESQDSKHKDEIEILSFSWGLGQAREKGGGRINETEFSIVKLLDSATPQMIETMCHGTSLGSGVLTVRKAGEKPLEYIKIKLTDVFIANYQTVASGGAAGLPTEQVSFAFSNVELTATQQKPDGSMGSEVTTSCQFGRRGV